MHVYAGVEYAQAVAAHPFDGVRPSQVLLLLYSRCRSSKILQP